ncbi:YqhG family protein [Virgibacillus sp. W0430]|uniref:YqhG family protein n=1 Tax=Virgibacillus sp. W0430 TaxID=3391580 RepID=UPI003F455439
MGISNLQQFLIDYFSAQQCTVLDNQEGLFTVQLTEEMDKTLMNRPFYWHFIKSTGNKGEPMKLTLITNPERRKEDGEWVHFGSPRLQQIFNHLKQSEKYVKLFEQCTTSAHTALFPWLVINIKISYKGKQIKDELFSIGINLVNGEMKTQMMQWLQSLQLNKTIPNYCYTLSPIITIPSGYLRIEKVLDDYVANQTHTWAEASIQTMEEEIQLIQHFYTEEEDASFREKEINELTNRYEPEIIYEVVNGGIVYLLENSSMYKTS